MNRRVDVSFDMSGPLSDVRVRNITAATYEGDMRLCQLPGGIHVSCKRTEFIIIKQTVQFQLLDHNSSHYLSRALEDENVVARASGKVKLTKGDYACNLNVSLRDFSPNSLRLTERYPGYRLACDVSADLKGRDFESMDGRAEVSRHQIYRSATIYTAERWTPKPSW